MALRLSLYYVALFVGVGIHLPFWPLWLKDRGLTATDIGLLMAAVYAAKITVNPVVGHLVDRRGDRKRPMVVMATAAALIFLLFDQAHAFWPILALTLMANGLWAGMMPVGESLAMMTVHRHHLDYGRVRLWGSLSFIASAALAGRLLESAPTTTIPWLVAGALALTALACLYLPDTRAAASAATPPPLSPLLRSRPFLLFLACAALNQGAHTAYYAFATIHWKAAGHSDAVIGLLWAEGVVAEVALFAVSGLAVRRAGPGGLLLLAGALGAVRWAVLGSTTWLPALAGVQLLHAATFGCAHLGAMHFIQQSAPAGLSARAQGIYSSVAMGIVPAALTPLTGALYAWSGGGTFWAMAALALASAAFGWALTQSWSAER